MPSRSPYRFQSGPALQLTAVAAALLLVSVAAALAADHGVNVGGSQLKFSPANLTIDLGDRVIWTWVGGSHNVVSGNCSGGVCTPDGKFSSGAVKSSGTFTHTFNTPGTFPYFCEPHGSSGMKGSITVQGPAPLTCTAMADPSAGNPPLNVQFTGSATGGIGPYTFSWDFMDGTAANTNQNPLHPFTPLGDYDVTLTVTDNASTMAQCHVTVTVTDLTCSAVADPNAGDAPLDVLLTGSGSGGTPPYTVSWNFIDGSPNGSGVSLMHTFNNPGVYDVMMHLTDDDGIMCMAMVGVTVSTPPCGPGDTDADGVCDSSDNCVGVYNPGQQDADADEIGSACDNCPNAYNPTQDDLDDDGAGDACDLTITNPLEGQAFTDCNTPPVITWTQGPFNRFRVFISWDPNFAGTRKVSSGDKLLRTTSWSVPLKKWRKACTNGGDLGNLYFRIFGKNSTTKATGFSSVVTATVP